MPRRMWTVVAAVVLAGALCGDAGAAEPPSRRDTGAGRAVVALTDAAVERRQMRVSGVAEGCICRHPPEEGAPVVRAGAPGPGAPGPGAPGPGAPEQEALGSGALGSGAPGQEAPGEGAGASAGWVPADFRAVMGYLPVREDGAWVAPRGACSAPTGPTRYDFAAACRAHDLGYDLLRYAARTGQPLGPWAREAVDAAFGRALDARCDALGGSVGCRSAAAIYHGVVVANSWRQDWRDPRPEPALPWVLLASALTLAPVVLNAALAAADRVLKRRDR